MKIALLAARYPDVQNTWVHEDWDSLAPLGLGYLAAYARHHIDNAEFIIENDPDAVIDAAPDLVGLSFVTMNASYAARQAERIRDALGCPVIAGGPHVSTLAQSLDPAFDLAVLGEGEQTFTDLLRLFRAERRLDPASLARIPGIAYRDESGAVVRTSPRPPVENLDEIPYPDRSLMRRRWLDGASEIQLMTSRGCLFGCAFCSTVRIWGRHYRYHSDEYVLGEIERIRNDFNPEVVHFYDDLFIGKRSRVLRLLARIRERGLHEGIHLRCHVRTDLLNDEIMEAFAATRFDSLGAGMESGARSVLKTLRKESVADRLDLAVELARRYDLEYTTCFIIGTPGETSEDLRKTRRWVTDNLDVFRFIQFGPLVILPGTEVWEWGRRIGVSPENLRGIAFEPEDFEDERRYFLERWPYLNAENVPREEIFNFIRDTRALQAAGYRFALSRQEVRRLRERLERAESIVAGPSPGPGAADWVARNVPIGSILRAKARRWRRGTGK